MTNDEQPGEKKPKVAKTMLYRKTKANDEQPSEDKPSEEKPSEEKPKVAKTMLYRMTKGNVKPPSEEQPSEEQPSEDKPKVAKTTLYRKPKDNDEQPGEDKPKVAKTTLYRKPQIGPDLPPEDEISPEPVAEKPKTKVAKTKLDHKLLMSIKSQYGERENERLQQEIFKRELEPVKTIEPIKAERKISSCPFSWTAVSTKERVKHCDKCQKPVYQLDRMELEQVDALILKRENREKYVLYERPDGKFMTSGCPVAHRRRLQMVGLVAAICICVVAAVAASIMMPPPPPPAAATAPAADSATEVMPPATVTPNASSASSTSGTSSHHYQAGDPMPVVPTSVPPTNEPQKLFSQQEQSGDFWQYPNGKPTEDDIKGSLNAASPNQ
jgi:hypothetical protein